MQETSGTTVPPIEATILAEASQERDTVPEVSQELKVVYVVPVKGEVSNGNIFQILKDLLRQDCAIDDFELVLVVNNTQEEIGGELFHENQTILDIAAYMNGQSDLPALQSWQAQIVEMAKKKQLKVVALDHSSVGFERKNISKARTIGDNLAIDRLSEADIKGEGAIVLMDIDTRIGRSSTTGIIDSLVQDKNVGMLKVQYDTIPGEGGKNIYRTSAERRFFKAVSRVSDYGRPPTALWYVIKASELGKEDPEKAMVSLRDNQKSRRTTLNAPSSVSFHTQDRARPGDVGGQFGERRLTFLDDDDTPTENIEHPVLGFIGAIYRIGNGKNNVQFRRLLVDYLSTFDGFSQRISDALAKGESITHFREIRALEKNNKVDVHDYGDTLLKMLRDLLGDIAPTELALLERKVVENKRRERMRHELARNSILKILEKVFPVLEVQHQISKDDFVGQLSEKELDFLRRNNWIIDEINQAYEVGDSFEEVVAKLTLVFPDILKTFDDTRYGRSTAICFAVTQFFEEAWNNPQTYPELTKLIKPENPHPLTKLYRRVRKFFLGR